MDKKTFIKELKLALSVLQQEELDDIISEYEQHIDMKQASGLTEEDAIADFGSLDELAAEILEAYHVRADYAAGQKKGKGYFTKEGKGDRESGQISAVCVKAGAAVTQGAGKAWHWLWGIFLFWGAMLKKPGVWMKNRWRKHMDYEEALEPCEGEEEGCREEGTLEAEGAHERDRTQFSGRSRRKSGMGWALLNGGRTAAGRVRGFLGNLCWFGIRMVLWGIRMAWNGACIGFALCWGCFGLFCLYCMGLLTVLLLQGYPLAGVTLGCVGLVMCSFSASWLSITMLKRSSNRKKAEDREHA